MGTLGNNIKWLRTIHGMTQAELGNVLGVSQNAIGNWETEKTDVKYENVLILAKHFNVNPTDLRTKDLTKPETSNHTKQNQTETKSKSTTQIQRLREQAGMTVEELADRCGVSVDTIKKLEDGTLRTPSQRTVEKMSRIFGVPTYQLREIPKQEDTPQTNTIEKKTLQDEMKMLQYMKITFDDYVDVPLYGCVSAGTGEEGFEEPIGKVPIPKRKYRKGVIAIVVRGNSMEPEYEDGSYVLVDRNYISWDSGDVMVVEYLGNFFIKQCSYNRKTGDFIMHSFNDEYADYVISRDCEDNWRIFGRVVGAYKEM